MCRRSNMYACTKVPYRVYMYIYIYTTGFQRLFAWRPRFKTRQSRASVAQDRWVMVERFELLPRVDVCMNHWPIFIAIFTGSRGCPPIIYRKTGGKPIDLSFNYSSSNGQLLLLRISFSFIAINLWIAIGSQFLRFVEFWKLNFLFKSKWRKIFTFKSQWSKSGYNPYWNSWFSIYNEI